MSFAIWPDGTYIDMQEEDVNQYTYFMSDNYIETAISPEIFESSYRLISCRENHIRRSNQLLRKNKIGRSNFYREQAEHVQRLLNHLYPRTS